MYAFLTAIAVIWVVFWITWFISAWITRSPVKSQQPQGVRIFFFPALLVVAGILLFSENTSGILVQRIIPDTLPVNLAGLILTLAGIGFTYWARLHLGRFWSSMPVIRVDHKLIRTGPYRFVRHPIYSGLLFGLIGTIIVVGTLVVILAVFVVLMVFFWKIMAEEKVLLEEFGDEYTQYKKEVPALIPFVK